MDARPTSRPTWHRRVAAIAGATMLLAAGLPARAQPPAAPAPPNLLQQLIEQAAGPDFRQQRTLILLALLQTDAAQLPADLAQQLVALRDQASPRPDQQVGAGARAARATALADKPGISDFATLAVARAQLASRQVATDFTVATTPYALYYLSSRDDSPARWDRLAALRHLSIAATFAAGPGASAFQDAELHYVLAGDRSPRDRGFREAVVDRLVARLTASDRLYAGAFNRWTQAYPEAAQLFLATKLAYDAWRLDLGPTTTAPRVAAKLAELAADLRARIAPAAAKALAQSVAAALQQDAALREEVGKMLDDEAARYAAASGPEVAVAAGYAHDPTTSDYTYLDVSSSWTQSSQLSYSLSAALSVNNSLTAATPASAGMALKRLRDYSGTADVTFGSYCNGHLTFDTSAALDRDELSAATIASVSAVATLTAIGGVAVPLSYTYSNRTADSTRHDSRFNVGLSVDAAGLLAAFKSGQ